jgi:hypothetical protein
MDSSPTDSDPDHNAATYTDYAPELAGDAGGA